MSRVGTLAATLLTAVGCAPEDLPANDPAPAPETASLAEDACVSEWSRRLVEPRLLGAARPDVLWYVPDRAGCLTVEDRRGEEPCPRGLYVPGRGEVHLVVTDPAGRGELPHALLHWALDVTSGSPDRGHRSEAWWLHLYQLQGVLDDMGI